MKTVRYVFSLFGILGALMSFVACSNKNDSNTATTTSSGYYWANNQCYAASTGQIVATTYCNNQYYMSGNVCYSATTGQVIAYGSCPATTGINTCYYNPSTGYYYSTTTGQPVAASSCSSTTNTTTPGIGMGCYGLYAAVGAYGAVQYVQCAGSNCSGKYLYSITMQMYQNCQ
jgi:hypothetical protein